MSGTYITFDLERLRAKARDRRDAAISVAQEQYDELMRSIDVVAGIAGTEFEANPTGEKSPPTPIIQEQEAEDGGETAELPEINVDRTYLGEARRIITSMPEPFTKNQVRKIMAADNPQWDNRSILSNIHNAFNYLSKRELIVHHPAQVRDAAGEFQWLRNGSLVATNPRAARSRTKNADAEPAPIAPLPQDAEVIRETRGSASPPKTFPADNGGIVGRISGEKVCGIAV